MSQRYRKLLGLAVGDHSLLAAEVVAGPPARVLRVAELTWPQGDWPADAVEVGKALGPFLRTQGFSARAAVVGIPAKWLLVKAKEVPPADAATLADLLRLEAETEFSSELKDLVFEYAGAGKGSDGSASILLMATQNKNVTWAQALCQAAGVSAAAVTPSALALGQATGRRAGADVLVLSAGAGGCELSAGQGDTSSIRHLRAPEPRGAFISDMRRALLTLGAASADRDMVLWNSMGPGAPSFDAPWLQEQLGFKVRAGQLPMLGADASAVTTNGHGDASRFAPAVALAMSALDGAAPMDFLHSRLAPPRQRLLPRWAVPAAIAVLLLLAGGLWAWADMRTREADIDAITTQLAGIKERLKDANDFVSKVTFAQAWHEQDARYLACVRDLTMAIPDDDQTYVTSLVLRDAVRSSGRTSPPTTGPGPDLRTLSGQMNGKTGDQQRVQVLVDRMRRVSTFADVKLGATAASGRTHEVSFSITFTYHPVAGS